MDFVGRRDAVREYRDGYRDGSEGGEGAWEVAHVGVGDAE